MANTPPTLPVIILGAGMVGLTLAQALKKAGIPYEVYERDSAADTEKGRGWALTVHWAFSALEECLPTDLFNRLEDIQVDPTLDDSRRFCFLDLATAIPKYVIPPSKRLRVNRRLLGNLLAEGIDITYNKTLASFTVSPGSESVTVTFTDGTATTGSLLIGTDGRNSKTRRLLLGEGVGALNPLPVRSIGTTITMTAEQFTPIRAIDPLLFQGSHADTGVYMWFSLVSSPAINGSKDTPRPFYEGQLIQSWLYRDEKDVAVPATDVERLALLKGNARHFESRLREAIEGLPADSKVLHIKLVDWVPVVWDNRGGRVTLAGDAAHAMTSYRGEAFNHGVADAAVLARNLVAAWRGGHGGEIGDAVGRYEEEMRERTWEAVLLSTQACLDAHDLKALRPDSPIVSKRAKVAREAREARARAKLSEVYVS